MPTPIQNPVRNFFDSSSGVHAFSLHMLPLLHSKSHPHERPTATAPIALHIPLHRLVFLGHTIFSPHMPAVLHMPVVQSEFFSHALPSKPMQIPSFPSPPAHSSTHSYARPDFLLSG